MSARIFHTSTAAICAENRITAYKRSSRVSTDPCFLSLDFFRSFLSVANDLANSRLEAVVDSKTSLSFEEAYASCADMMEDIRSSASRQRRGGIFETSVRVPTTRRTTYDITTSVQRGTVGAGVGG